MKKLRLLSGHLYFRVMVWCCAIMLLAGNVIAQDKKVDIDVGIKNDNVWYQQPWAWVVGAAIFILLLVAILRSGRSRNE